MRRLKVGFVGAGFIARFQVVAMTQVRGLDLAGVTARAGAAELAAMARRLGVGEPVVYETVTEMAKHVEVVAILAPNFARIPITEELVAAVGAGAEVSGVICEKPLGRNLAEARRLVELAESARLRTAYFENQIFMKPIRVQMAQLAPVQRVMGPLSLLAVGRGTRRAARGLVLGSHAPGRRRAVRHGVPQHRRRPARADPAGQGQHVPRAAQP